MEINKELCINKSNSSKNDYISCFETIYDYDGLYTCSYCLDLFYDQENKKHKKHNHCTSPEELCIVCHLDEWNNHMYHYEDTFDLFGDNIKSMYYISCRFCRFITHKNQECIPFICEYCYYSYENHLMIEHKDLGQQITLTVSQEIQGQINDFKRKNNIRKLREILKEKSIFVQCHEKNNCYICHEFFHDENNSDICCFCQERKKRNEIIETER